MKPTPFFRVDETSLLVEVDAHCLLADVERDLHRRGLTFGLDPVPSMTVGEWLERGAESSPSPWADPADHLVAGFEAHFADGSLVRRPPVPRRAEGPDLWSLLFGQQGRFGVLLKAWVRIRRRGIPRPNEHPPFTTENPPLCPEERRLLDAIEREMKEGMPFG